MLAGVRWPPGSSLVQAEKFTYGHRAAGGVFP